MAKKVVFLTIHGMGDTEPGYANDIVEAMREKLTDDWDAVEHRSIYYQTFLQPNEYQYYNATKSRVSWGQLRKLMINGFADAGSLEYSRGTPGGPYYLTQDHIFTTLGQIYDDLGGTSLPVVVIAHSLGCEVISNYIWDANKEDKTYGYWKDAEKNAANDGRLKFQKLQNLRLLFTTGCNIPVFITGLKEEERIPINKPHKDFIWENYYDKDDVLGYPLTELSPAYGALVKDVKVSVGNLFTGWNPFSHNEYWDNSGIQRELSKHLKAFV
ncbi:hypothetical protein JJB09_06990 [Rhizobium sp. KVB221]|uniref:Uncharacterized protein n=1 Tax=Rhizobium setariae TaxID=2801340 RepID=A0A936YK40_9HYPH|nr:hypothetical protein [Rhizobium setariae]MBL0371770.1 hypothetical protein [Rhizobium setariae]